jgi:hypothetical protein
MSLLPEREQLIQKIETIGSPARDGAKARLDTLLVSDLVASFDRLDAELTLTREQMASSSDAVSRHQRALVRWTIVLSLATIAYTVAAFLPFLWRPFALSTTADHAWVLWGPAAGNVSGSREGTFVPIDAVLTKDACLNLKDVRGTRWVEVKTGGYFCLPDTVDPRGPKGK